MGVHDSPSGRRWDIAYAAALLAAFMTMVAPIWTAPILPLSDFANHVARLHVLAHWGDVPRYQTFYEPVWGPYPNLALDLAGVPLAKLTSADTAVRLFLTLTVTLWCAACLTLGRAVTGRRSWRALIACLLAFHESFLLGYANFSFGMAIALFAIALFVSSRDRVTARRLALFGALGLVTVVSHAAAFVTLTAAAAVMAAVELADARRKGLPSPLRPVVKRLAPLGLGAAYFVAWLALFADHSKDRGFSSPGTSLRLLVQTIVPSYDAKLDVAVLGALAVAAAVALAASRPLALRAPFTAAAGALAVLVFVAPADFGGGYEANGRYVVGAWVLGLFAIEPRAGITRAARALGVVCVAVLLGRQVAVGLAWNQLGRDMEAQVALLEGLPPGAALGNVTYFSSPASRAVMLRERATLHATSIAAITREANVPTLYAIPGVQPLRHREPRYDAHRFHAERGAPPDVDRIRAELDAALVCRAPPPLLHALGGR